MVSSLPLTVLNQRVTEGWMDQSGKVLGAEFQHLQKRPKKTTAVLGKETMGEVWKDMKRTTLPPWISPAPAQIGTSKTGKLSADQWRTTATVHFVVTLVRLWGSDDPTSRQYKMLTNFMDLVTATKLATMRSMSSSRISVFKEHMKRYLDGMLVLYTDVGVSPGQHMSLHFEELLSRFGPTHGWRGWVFERMNYKLQQVPTNKKFGKLSKPGCKSDFTYLPEIFTR